MEATIRRYFDGCDNADVELMASCSPPDVVRTIVIYEHLRNHAVAPA